MNKAERVIKSCKTLGQLSVAFNYISRCTGDNYDYSKLLALFEEKRKVITKKEAVKFRGKQ